MIPVNVTKNSTRWFYFFFWKKRMCRLPKNLLLEWHCVGWSLHRLHPWAFWNQKNGKNHRNFSIPRSTMWEINVTPIILVSPHKKASLCILWECQIPLSLTKYLYKMFISMRYALKIEELLKFNVYPPTKTCEYHNISKQHLAWTKAAKVIFM